jgi:hypothetical protein
MPGDKNIYLFVYYLLTYDILKQAVSNLDSVLVASNCRKTCEHRHWRNVDWNGCDMFQGIMLLMARTDLRNPPKHLIQERRCPG